MRDAGALRNMIIAAQHERGTIAAGAGQIGMAENIAGTIHARAFAIPDTDHAIVLRVTQHMNQLAAED